MKKRFTVLDDKTIFFPFIFQNNGDRICHNAVLN
jgi:hypothetical protein